MGSGSWSASAYSSTAAARAAAGIPNFNHSHKIQTGQTAAKAHDLLDPTVKATDQSGFAGKVMRECAISDEHPNPTAVAIMLDVTGSNIEAARAVHAKLPQLFGVLQRIGGIEDPQVLMGAIGDANSDTVPLQVGQFESDNRIDDMVDAMYLEGNGGGQARETYELGAYFLAYHTHLDSWHTQGRRGYAIFIGDEKPYDMLKRDYSRSYHGTGHTLQSLIGDTLEDDLSTKEIFEKLQEQYETFFLFQRQGMYTADAVLPEWRALLAENAMVLEDPDTVCEFVAGLLAMKEGGLDDLDDVKDALAVGGFDPAAIASVSKSLELVTVGGGAVAKTDGSLNIPDSTGTERL